MALLYELRLKIDREVKKEYTKEEIVERKLPDNALGNDPRIRAVLEQFMNQ